MGFFLLHFVLKDRDILVRLSSLRVPEKQCRLCLTRVATPQTTGSKGQSQVLDILIKCTHPFFGGWVLFNLCSVQWSTGISFPLQIEGNI